MACFKADRTESREIEEVEKGPFLKQNISVL